MFIVELFFLNDVRERYIAEVCDSMNINEAVPMTHEAAQVAAAKLKGVYILRYIPV